MSRGGGGSSLDSDQEDVVKDRQLLHLFFSAAHNTERLLRGGGGGGVGWVEVCGGGYEGRLKTIEIQVREESAAGATVSEESNR